MRHVKAQAFLFYLLGAPCFTRSIRMRWKLFLLPRRTTHNISVVILIARNTKHRSLFRPVAKVICYHVAFVCVPFNLKYTDRDFFYYVPLKAGLFVGQEI